MLLSFSVSNHRSIRAEQTLHLQPVYDKSRPALPVIAIFGANAAGKSTVLDALRFMVAAVRESFSSWADGIPRSPFALASGARAEPSAFAVELLLDGVRYDYGFTVDDDRVVDEWLYCYPRHRRRLVFERTGQDVRVARDSQHRARAEVLTELMPRTALFLAVAARSPWPETTAVNRWFTAVLGWAEPRPGHLDEASLVREMMYGRHGQQLAELIPAADLGISKVAPVYHLAVVDRREAATRLRQAADALEPDSDAEQINDVMETVLGAAPLLRFWQGEADLGLEQQSRGTHVWISHLLPALVALDSGSLLVIDEINSSLHPRLSAKLVGLFRDPRTNPLSAQLIFTTHDVALLGRQDGEDVLGRDEVWFVEKGRDGTTTLYALADFKPRKDENTERRYLSGAYGAVPTLLDGDFADLGRAPDGDDGRAAS